MIRYIVSAAIKIKKNQLRIKTRTNMSLRAKLNKCDGQREVTYIE